MQSSQKPQAVTEFPIINRKERIAHAFDAAAQTYDDASHMQDLVAHLLDRRLTEFIDEKQTVQRIVDLGCGTGLSTQLLAERFPTSAVLACDISAAMIEKTRERLSGRVGPRLAFSVCDGEYARFSPAPDLIASSLCVQWFDDVETALVRHARAARYIAFAILLNGSFSGWIHAHGRRGIPHGMRTLPSLDRCVAALASLPSKRFAVTIEHLLDSTAPPIEFVRRLRAIGAASPRSDYRPGALRSIFRDFPNGYAAEYSVGFFCVDMGSVPTAS